MYPKVAHFALINVSVFIKIEIGLGEIPDRKNVVLTLESPVI